MIDLVRSPSATALVDRALAEEAGAQLEPVRVAVLRRMAVAGEQLEVGVLALPGVAVDEALVRPDQRHELREQDAADRGEVAPALEQRRDAREVGLEPVLLPVALGGQPEVADHGVDVVLQLGDLAARVDLDRPGQVALGHGGGDLGDGAHLGGQVRRQQVDVAGQVLPGARRSGDVGLSAEPPLDADLAGDGGHLLGEGREGVDHGVDGLAQGGHLALGANREAALQVALRDRGHDPHDAAHLLGEVGGHDVDVVGQVLPDS